MQHAKPSQFSLSWLLHEILNLANLNNCLWCHLIHKLETWQKLIFLSISILSQEACMTLAWLSLRKQPFSKKLHYLKLVQIRSFFRSVFSCIRIEYRDLRRNSSYSFGIQKNTNQKKFRIFTFFTQWLTFLLTDIKDIICWYAQAHYIRG